MNKDQGLHSAFWQVTPLLLAGSISVFASACRATAQAYIIEPRKESVTPTAAKSRVAIVGERIELSEGIHFGDRSAQILNESLPVLNELAVLLKKHPEITLLRVEGHSSRKETVHNKQLSEQRAAAVKDYLTSQKIPQSVVSTGFADQMPLCSEATPACEAKNRRIDLIIQTRSTASSPAR